MVFQDLCNASSKNFVACGALGDFMWVSPLALSLTWYMLCLVCYVLCVVCYMSSFLYMWSPIYSLYAVSSCVYVWYPILFILVEQLHMTSLWSMFVELFIHTISYISLFVNCDARSPMCMPMYPQLSGHWTVWVVCGKDRNDKCKISSVKLNLENIPIWVVSKVS